MALSMDEQHILDGMERKLADDDPRLASKLTAFGQPRLPALLESRKARAIVVLVSLALAVLVSLMVYSMRPTGGLIRPTQPSHRPSVAAKPGTRAGQQPATGHQSAAARQSAGSSVASRPGPSSAR